MAKRSRKWGARAVVAVSLLSIGGVLAYAFHWSNVSEPLSLMVADAFAIIFVAVIVTKVGFDLYDARVAVERKEQEIETVQQEFTESDLGILDLLDRAIRLAITREEASMLRAEARANMLFRIGLIFMVASVLAPLFSASLYWRLDPLAASTVENLKSLRSALGSLPQGTTIAIQRDWRVLLGGISFGFLFLAAAAGLMKQQGRQTDIYFRTGERVKYFERLASVVNLHSVAARKRSDGFDRELVNLVTEKLIANDSGIAIDNGSDPAGGGSVNVNPATEILRAFNKYPLR